MELERTLGPPDGSPQSPPQKCAWLSCLRGPPGTLARGAGVGTRGLPATTYTRWPRRCLAPAAAGNKGCLSGKGEGEGSRPPTRSHPPSFSPPRQWLPGERVGRARAGRGCGFDPFLRSCAPIPLRAFRGAGRGVGESQAVSVGWPPPPSPAPRAPERPPAPCRFGRPSQSQSQPLPSPAWPPQTATTVQTRLKRNVNPSPSLLALILTTDPRWSGD